MGWYLAQQHRHFTTPHIVMLLVVAIILQYSEAFLLWHYYGIMPTSHDFLASTIFVSFSMVLILLRYPNFGNTKVVTQLGQYTLGIYVMHYLFVDLLNSLEPYMPNVTWDIVYPLLVYLVTLASVILLSKISGIKKLVT